MFLAPPWAIDAQAIYSSGDPFLAPGVHVRILPSPLIGLPVTPLLVYRTPLYYNRTDVEWTDMIGNRVPLPIKLGNNQVVYGRLPPATSARCCLLELETSPDSRLTNFARTMHLGGEVTVALSTTQPYTVSSSDIQRVMIVGPGEIRGARWVDAHALLHGDAPGGPMLDRTAIWSLPIGRARGYLGNYAFFNEIFKRIADGAPPRFPLFQDGRGDPATPNDEMNRVFTLVSKYMPQITRLTGTGGPQSNLGRTEPMSGTRAGGVRATARTPLLGEVLQSALDPGMARVLGFGHVDPIGPDVKQKLVTGALLQSATADRTPAGYAYVIRGFWPLERARLGQLSGEIPASAESSARTLPARFAAMVGTYQDPASGQSWTGAQLFPDEPRLELDMPVVEMCTLACAPITKTQPPDAPRVDTIQQGEWQPPDASGNAVDAWDLTFRVSLLVRAAAVALVRSSGGTDTLLNPTTSNTPYRVGLFAGMQRGETSAPKEPGAGIFADRAAPPAGASYRVAQSDWFGRWSGWTTFNVGPKARPVPPAPVLTLAYVPPASPSGTGLLAGTLKLRVQLLTSRPPGGRNINLLQVAIKDIATRTFNVALGGVGWALGAAPPGGQPHGVTAVRTIDGRELEIVVGGPALAPTKMVNLEVTANWRDDGDQPSATVTATREIYDPRPPPQLPQRTLQYTARPDVTGFARAEIPIGGTGAHLIRVYYTDETTIAKALARRANNAADPQIAAVNAAIADLTLNAGKSPAERANAHDRHKAVFDAGMFEILTADGIPGTSSTFAHAVSGSLQILSFYRPITVSEANVPSDFATAPLYPYAVPNEPPPAQPLLSVTSRASAGQLLADLAIRVPRGAAQPSRYRIRRTSVPGTEPRRMLVAREDDVPAAAMTIGPDGTDIKLTDDGSVSFQPGARLKPWYRYTWVAEVRAAAPAGGAGPAPVGEWSPPSNPVTVLLVPPEPPAAVGQLMALSSGGGVRLTWSAGTLDGGHAGSFRFEIYRQRAGAAMEPPIELRVGDSALTYTPGTWAYQVADGKSGDRYTVIVVDPVGRSSGNNSSTSVT